MFLLLHLIFSVGLAFGSLPAAAKDSKSIHRSHWTMHQPSSKTNPHQFITPTIPNLPAGSKTQLPRPSASAASPAAATTRAGFYDPQPSRVSTNLPSRKSPPGAPQASVTSEEIARLCPQGNKLFGQFPELTSIQRCLAEYVYSRPRGEDHIRLADELSSGLTEMSFLDFEMYFEDIFVKWLEAAGLSPKDVYNRIHDGKVDRSLGHHQLGFLKVKFFEELTSDLLSVEANKKCRLELKLIPGDMSLKQGRLAALRKAHLANSSGLFECEPEDLQDFLDTELDLLLDETLAAHRSNRLGVPSLMPGGMVRREDEIDFNRFALKELRRTLSVEHIVEDELGKASVFPHSSEDDHFIQAERAAADAADATEEQGDGNDDE